MLKLRVYLLAFALSAAYAAHAGAQSPLPAPQPLTPTSAGQPPATATGTPPSAAASQGPAPAAPPRQPSPIFPTLAPVAQAPPQTPTAPTGTLALCNGMYQIGPPSKLPPTGSGPVVYQVGPCFAKQGGLSVIDATPDRTVTLTTCHPKGSAAQRLVAKATWVKNLPAA